MRTRPLFDDVDSDLREMTWQRTKDGYAQTKLPRNGSAKRKQPLAQRLVLARALGRPLLPHELCDHINHNGLDNRRQNLRVVTAKANAEHRRGAQRNNRSSGIRGVTWDPGIDKWAARVKHWGRSYWVGAFEDIDEAAMAVREFRRTLGFLGEE